MVGRPQSDNFNAIPRIAHGDEIVYSREAKKAHARGHELLQPTKPVAVSAGEAVTWENRDRVEHRQCMDQSR
jgi:plastocyanin